MKIAKHNRMYKTLHKITRILSSFSLIVALTLGPLVSLAMPQQVQAAYEPCIDRGVVITSGNVTPKMTPAVSEENEAAYAEGELTSITIELDVSNLATGNYKARVFDSNAVITGGGIQTTDPFEVTSTTTKASITFTAQRAFNIQPAYEGFDKEYKYIHLYKEGLTGQYLGASYCELGYYAILNDYLSCTEAIKVVQMRDTDGDPATPPKECVANDRSSCVDTSSEFLVSVKGLVGRDGQPYSGKVLAFQVHDTTAPGELTFTTKLDDGQYDMYLSGPSLLGARYTRFRGPCTASFKVEGRCNIGDSCSSNFNPNVGPNGSASTYELCAQIGDSTPEGEAMKNNCLRCNEQDGVWTAVGCIKNNPKDIVARFIEIGLGLGGGVCLLTCLAGGFMITTSQGEPKKINDAKEMITNALIGLLFIIFSVTILQFIGVTIFNIPGFGTTTP